MAGAPYNGYYGGVDQPSFGAAWAFARTTGGRDAGHVLNGRLK